VPLKYLGLPLGASFKLKTMWAGLEDMMSRRLVPWKRLYLSKGGRVTLIKSTLSNMPTYMLSLFPIPVDVAKCLEKIQRDFLWGGMNDDFKYHLVEWDKVCTLIDEEGLGIRNIRRFNQALLGKWLWWFAHEEGAWWRSVLVAKYGSDWEVGIRESFQVRMGWACGNIFVWDGRILGGSLSMMSVRAQKFAFGMMFGVVRALKEVYPGLFSIASLKEASIADNMEHSSNSIQWNIQFTRLLHDWELGELASFYTSLYDCKL
jgi:hypothetical protein